MTTSAPLAKVSLNLLRLDKFPVFNQLQLEEALLRADTGNWCLLNAGASPAIVMGISGVHESLINPQHMKKKPVPVIRRFSGGGTVFVDHNTIFATWICNTEEMHVPCCPQKVHAWTAEFYQKAFPTLDMQLRENDYVIGERKWGGNAQYLCKGRWLHHTSMLWDYDLENMEYLLMPAKVPSYRKMRAHEEFLCGLRKYFPERSQVEASIINRLKQQFVVNEVSLAEVAGILERPHRKATAIL